jgi:hypothetical protein
MYLHNNTSKYLPPVYKQIRTINASNYVAKKLLNKKLEIIDKLYYTLHSSLSFVGSQVKEILPV